MTTRRTKKNDTPSNSETDITSRLVKVVNALWGGVLSHMARDLHLPQPMIWKTVKGKQAVSGQLLVALARLTHVNLHWLIHGVGPMTLEVDGVHSGARVVDGLLPGTPDAHPHRFLPDADHPLASGFVKSQYWVRVKQSDPVARAKTVGVEPGDWLLLETDPQRFPSEDEMEDKLIVIPTAGHSGEPELGVVETVGELTLSVHTFDLAAALGETIKEEIALRQKPDGKWELEQREFVEVVVKHRGRSYRTRREPTLAELAPMPVPVRYQDVLAVCVLTARSR